MNVLQTSLKWLSIGMFAALVVFGLDGLLCPAEAFAAGASIPEAEIHHSFGNSKGVAFFFWFLALCTLGGSIFVITRRNMVTAVMGMVGTFFAIAGLYLMLYASFLAVMQVLVYAGAIMVLFVFVIMILNRPEAEPWAMEGLLGKGMAAIGILYLFKRLSTVLWNIKDTQGLELVKDNLHEVVTLNGGVPGVARCIRQHNIADDIEKITALCPDAISRVYEFGTVKGVGYTLFTKYLFPFEAVSLVLLVAVVGAIAVARPSKKEHDDGNTEAKEVDHE